MAENHYNSEFSPAPHHTLSPMLPFLNQTLLTFIDSNILEALGVSSDLFQNLVFTQSLKRTWFKKIF